MASDPLRRLARVLLKRSGGRCENFTRLAGECFKSGRRVLAKYGAEQACPACLAHRALTLASQKRHRPNGSSLPLRASEGTEWLAPGAVVPRKR
jgi:hypothetical protein